MRSARVKINNVDIYTSYMAVIDVSGYDSLVAYPPLKQVKYNDWVEENGIEPDLSSLKLDKKDVTIKFHCLGGDTSNVTGLYEELTQTPVVSINFVDLGRTFSLRVTSMPSLSYAQAFKSFEVEFVAITPTEWLSSVGPVSSLPANSKYKIDGTNLSSYGVIVTKGTIDSALRCAPVKTLLTRNLSTTNGETYDKNIGNDSSHATVKTGTKEIELSCFMKAASASAFWQNYGALLRDLVAIDEDAEDVTLAGMRTLYIEELSTIFQCYYKEASVSRMRFIGSAIWIEFSVTLVQIAYTIDEGAMSCFASFWRDKLSWQNKTGWKNK